VETENPLHNPVQFSAVQLRPAQPGSMVCSRIAPPATVNASATGTLDTPSGLEHSECQVRRADARVATALRIIAWLVMLAVVVVALAWGFQRPHIGTSPPASPHWISRATTAVRRRRGQTWANTKRHVQTMPKRLLAADRRRRQPGRTRSPDAATQPRRHDRGDLDRDGARRLAAQSRP
jgi:hypothetical protein